MLCFVTTDAKIDRKKLGSALQFAVGRSFNAITVDGDTSTNDSVFVLANGASGAEIKTASEYSAFSEALTGVLKELAMLIVRDGEGATRFVKLNIENADTYEEAVRVGRAVGTSPLVKTAIFGGDPNWGRVVSAIGNSDAKFDPARIELRIEGISVYRKDEPQKVDLQVLEDLFSKKEIEITIRLNAGKESAQVFTCDLSYDYVKINGEYTT
ncbi:MAG TPA: bifunctional ornithine acetyltransferase/N-acetylglutamate synthase, partial [Candidatus Kryptobacter bacterium]|nr:bifunctional ornithine acetyltransferase/N-acetylglutamate synthase [Candidatus Kryptobacter bacterium]